MLLDREGALQLAHDLKWVFKLSEWACFFHLGLEKWKELPINLSQKTNKKQMLKDYSHRCTKQLFVPFTNVYNVMHHSTKADDASNGKQGKGGGKKKIHSRKYRNAIFLWRTCLPSLTFAHRAGLLSKCMIALAVYTFRLQAPENPRGKVETAIVSNSIHWETQGKRLHV